MRTITRYALIGQRAIFSIISLQAILYDERSARIEGTCISLKTSLEVSWMHAAGPAVPDFLFHFSPGKFQPRFIEKRAELVFARHPDQNGRGIGHRSETILAFLQGSLTRSKSLSYLSGAEQIEAEFQ